MNKINILIADDHPTFREGLRRLLEEEQDFDIVGSAAEGMEAVSLAKKLKPDLVLMDVKMPKLDGAQAAREIHKYCPKMAVLMLSAFDYEANIVTSLRAGARGYVSKRAPLNQLVDAIRLVHGGVSVFDIGVTEKIMNISPEDGHGENGRNNGNHNWLHNREVQVLNLVGKGMSNREIGDELKVSERTVQTHLVNIYRKLGANSRTQAIIHALRKGWLNVNELNDRRAVD